MARASFRLFLLALLTIGLSFLFPVVTNVRVQADQYYSEEEIIELANIKVGTPFLWISDWWVQALAQDPWIEHVSIQKAWPNEVLVTVSERRPFLVGNGVILASDGTELPYSEKLLAQDNSAIPFEGWGKERHQEMVMLVHRLKQHSEPLKMVSYSPAGFQIQFAESQLFTPSLEALEAHWAGFEKQYGSRVSIYPWGVSAAND